MLHLLDLEPLDRRGPVQRRFRRSALGNLSGAAEAVPLSHQLVEVADPDVGIPGGVRIPAEGQKHRLFRLASRSDLQPDAVSKLGHVPAARQFPYLAPEGGFPVLAIDDHRHGCAQNVPKTSLSGPDSLRQHRPEPL